MVASTFQRSARSFAAVVGAYLVYALAAVPFIEPEENPTEYDGGPTDWQQYDVVGDMRADLQRLFLPGDWELTSPKVLETQHGILLVKEYRNLPDGRMELRPCTMIFLPEERNDSGAQISNAERWRQAIVLRAPEGATLRFDSALDLKSAQMGTLVGGKLNGPVTIRSDYREPGPHDDLLVHTSDVELSTTLAWSPQPIDFQLGPNRGRGRRMTIHFAANNTNVGLRGITTLELAEDVQLRLEPGGADVFPGAARSDAPTAQKRPQPPVEIRCRGPFRFDFASSVAVFHDQVDVTRLVANGANDQLTCELLSIFFASAAVDATTTKAKSENMRLQPTRVEALGSPVFVRAASSGVQARGPKLEYDIASGGATLSGADEVLLRQGQREIRARRIFAKPDGNGSVGEFHAVGPGRLRGATPDDANQSFAATWGGVLHFRPHEGQQLLSAGGGASIELSQQGTLNAQELHFWLRPAPPRPVKHVGPGDEAQPARVELVPDRLQATGNVKFESPQLVGLVDRMEAWFEQTGAAPIAGRAHQVQRPPQPVASSAPARRGESRARSSTALGSGVVPVVYEQPLNPANPVANAGAAAAAAPAQRLLVEGKRLRLRVSLRESGGDLSEVIVDDNVRLRELTTARPDEQPLRITGDQLHMVQPPNRTTSDQQMVTVTGRPGHIEARGLTLDSAAIHLDRGRNLMWTDAAGSLTLPMNAPVGESHTDKSPTNAAPPPTAEATTVTVTWQGKMQFDGRRATFTRQVESRRPTQYVRTEQLEVTFTEAISFSAMPGTAVAPGPVTNTAAAGPKTEIDQLVCKQGVYLENRSVEAGRVTSVDQVNAVELSIHQSTGAVVAKGPGTVTTIRIDANANSAAAPGALVAVGKTDPKSPPLTYLNVTFQRGATGNLKRRDLKFDNQVRTLYAQVSRWDARVDSDRPETWGPRGLLLACDQMNVAEMPAIVAGQTNLELEALGNTTIEATGYTARAARLTFSQGKDLLVLEGTSRSPARVYRQERGSSSPTEVAARKILFWPTTNRLEVDDAQYIDLKTLPTALPAR